MKYWKRIQLEHVEIIQKKTLALMAKHSDIMDRTKFKGSFIPFPDQYLDHVPEVNQAFAPYGRVCVKAAVYLMWNNRDAMPHVDGEDSIARVNIPLLNCEGTSTVFYENIKTMALKLPTGVVYHPVVNTDYYEVDRVEINSPTILRVTSGHSIIMDEARAPRITLTLMLDPDIHTLLDD